MPSSRLNKQSFQKRLFKNKGATFGLLVIFLSFGLAVFAYLVAPDHSPNANQMTVEIGGAKPGFHLLFLKVKGEAKSKKAGLLSWILNGKEEDYSLLPIISFEKVHDSVVVRKYIDEGIWERQS